MSESEEYSVEYYGTSGRRVPNGRHIYQVRKVRKFSIYEGVEYLNRIHGEVLDFKGMCVLQFDSVGTLNEWLDQLRGKPVTSL